MIHAEDALPVERPLALPLAVETLRRADLGQFALDEPLATVAPSTPDGVAAHGHETIHAALVSSLTLADGDAANRLLDLVGRGEVNETSTRMGLSHTHIASPFGVHVAHRENVTSAADMLKLLTLIRSNALPGAHELRAILAETAARPPWLPEGASVARLRGATESAYSDVGILTFPTGNCVYCFLATQQSNALAAIEAAEAIIRELCRAWGGV